MSASGVWTAGGMVNGDSVSLSLSASVDAGTGGLTIVNSASITAADDVDADPLNNSASISLTVQSADLALAMSLDDSAPNEGDLVWTNSSTTRSSSRRADRTCS